MIVTPERLSPEEYYQNTDLEDRKNSVDPEWPNSTNYNGFLSPKCFIIGLKHSVRPHLMSLFRQEDMPSTFSAVVI
jgi:hypothetical protein